MQKLYILPFDHRASFAKLFGYSIDALTGEEHQKMEAYKLVVYEVAKKLADQKMVPREHIAILADEEFGKEVHARAKEDGIARILTVEKSGQDVFDFEYGNDFTTHIEAIDPEYVKVLVRHNVSSDPELKKMQIDRLLSLQAYLQGTRYKFLFELLVPPTESDLRKVEGDGKKYEEALRPKAMEASIRELEDAGIHPAIWKIEGIAHETAFKGVVAAATEGKTDTGVVVLGRAESKLVVSEWIRVAGTVGGVVGFAVGRTIFAEPLKELHAGTITKEQAIDRMAADFLYFVEVFEGKK